VAAAPPGEMASLTADDIERDQIVLATPST